MKTLFYLAAILLATAEAIDPRLILLRAVVQGDKSISRLDSSSSSSIEDCTIGKTRECTSCSSAKICLPNGVPIATINCTTFSPSTPFCNTENGLCTAQQPASCGVSVASFPCPSQDGIYPDPKDCAQFHYCINGIDTPIICPKNNVYDHDLGTCKLRKKLSDCVKFNCAKKEGEDILYPKDDRIWATCAGGDAYIMGRCKDYERYDVSGKKCSRVCRVVENQPIDGTCNKYMRCADIGGGTLVPYEFPCPPGQNFDSEKKLCSADATCPTSGDSDDSGSEADDTEESSSEGSNDNKTVDEIDNNESDTPSSRINNSGNENSGNNVTNGEDEVNGNLVNGNGNANNSNNGNIGSGNRARVLSRIINNSGNNNANNSVENGDDNVEGNLINGNNNGNNKNSVNQGRGLISRINNSGNLNSGNTVSNGNDETNGNLVNGNDNSQNSNIGNVGSGNERSLVSRIINNSGDNNRDNELTNGNDSVNGNLINGNNNGNNLDSGNRGRGLISRINNSGNLNSGNNVSNGDDDTNGNLINGNENVGNTNNGNVGSGNWQRRITPRIINNSGDNNSGNSVANGDDNVAGDVINGNNNINNDNSNNSADKTGSDYSPFNQSTGNGSSSSDRGGNFEQNDTDDNEKTPHLTEAIENFVDWLKDKITNRQKSGDQSPETVSPNAEPI